MGAKPAYPNAGFRSASGRSAFGQVLKALAENPAAVAAAYGKLTGNCCFCGSNLSNARSTGVGYGKTCAEHYGLSWG